MTIASCHRRRPSPAPSIPSTAPRGFTLLELLGVITIIGVLAGLVIPTVTAVKVSANRVRTRVQFDQWVMACTQFRQEYGYLPTIGTGNKLKTAADSQAFVRMLSGRNPDGSEVVSVSDLMGNTKRVAFHLFGESEMRDGVLADAFGNTEFGVLWDADGDGLIKPGSDGAAPSVQSVGGANFIPLSADLPASGVRADVIFYSAGRGATDTDMVLSWK